MAAREVDLLGEAIAGTEAEIFGEAVDGAEVETGDDEADRSLEAMDEVEDAADTDEGEDGDAEGEDEAEGDKLKAEAKPDRDDKGKFAATAEKPEAGDEQPERKGNPAVALREERQQRQVLKAELDKERQERAAERDSYKSDFAKLEGRLDQVLRTQQPVAQKAETPKSEAPDIFTDPDGYRKWSEDQIQAAVSAVESRTTERFINASLADAHDKHGEAFDTAFKTVSALDRSNPANVAVLRNIREAPNPGAALMRWHTQQEALREVGTDLPGYRQKIVDDTRAALVNDPEFRKQILADLKAEAGGSNGGKARTIIRTPPSLNGAAGRGESQLNPRTYDNSERATFDSAFE